MNIMEEIDIDVSLSERELRVGDERINLSNYDIKHLREISGEKGFDEETCIKAVYRLIDERIEPFIISLGLSVNKRNIENEFSDAFSSHLYSFLQD